MQLCTARLHPKGTSPRCALRAPRLLRSLAMTNPGALPSRVIPRSEATWESHAGTCDFAGGFPVFRPVLRDCRALLRKARNDKSRAFTVLTIVCQFRRYSAGPGCPLPYNITSHCKRAGRAVRPFSIIISFSFNRGYRRCTCARRSPSTRHRCQNTGRSYCP